MLESHLSCGRAQVRRARETGREELVVVGGYYSSVLAEMTPFTLDLGSFYWRCWPGLPEPGPGGQAPEQALPAPRQRMAAQRVTDDWMLVSGGSPASVRARAARPACCVPIHPAPVQSLTGIPLSREVGTTAYCTHLQSHAPAHV